MEHYYFDSRIFISKNVYLVVRNLENYTTIFEFGRLYDI